ncbi:uncharacterized protein IWZ02DRAFT_25215 [Phyllosticta citriasiana]|uniref:Uncharacterized protein n=3 Tax=Phyllosticta TaxID=121621 RepID=A0ABR1LHD1_9PEZI
MPIRNPFRRTPGSLDVADENQRPNGAATGFQHEKAVGVKPIDIKEPAEYKLSEINDSGVYLPPSPPEKKTSFWSTKSSTSSLNHRKALTENEPFSISRESFDSYRRSFDISARSPVVDNLDIRPRQSLDSRAARLPRSSLNERRFERPLSTADEGFEDVGLNDDPKPKKKGFFSRFGDSSESLVSTSRSSSFHIPVPGRKRGQSGHGSELGPLPRPAQTPNGGIPEESN